MKKKIYVVGYPGESGRNMMLDIQKREDTTLIDDLWGGERMFGENL